MARHTYAADRRHADRIVLANLSQRFFRLDRYERYVNGTQYDGRPSWWDDRFPLQDRRPCIVYPIAWRAIRSNVDLILGEGRWPTFTTLIAEDDSAVDEEFGLSEDDSEVLDRLIKAIVEQTNLETTADSALEDAQSVGTAVSIGSIKDGRLCVENTLAKWCTPTFDIKRPSVITRLEIRYPYVLDFDDPQTGRKSCKAVWYRRVIDPMQDIVYRPTEALPNGAEPDTWIVDKDRSAVHALGFCPVVWYKHLPKCDQVETVDGRPIHDLLLDEIDGLNFSLSQRHRAARYCGDPQIVETGVDLNATPAPMGQQPSTIYAGGDDNPANKGWAMAGNLGGYDGSGGRFIGGGSARKKGPGSVWRYEQSEAKVSMLTLPGDALKSISDDATALLAMIKESMAVVFLDPDNIKIGSDLSGRALEWLCRKQIDRCNKIRAEFARNWLLPVLSMCLRIAMTMVREPARGALYLSAVAPAMPILERYERDVQQGDGSIKAEWFPPTIHPRWGPYFRPTSADFAQDQKGAIEALDAGVILEETAVEKVKTWYGIENVAEYVEKLRAAKDQREQKANEAQHALLAASQPNEEATEPVNASAATAKQEAQEVPDAAEQPPTRAARTPPKFKRRMKPRQPQATV